MYTIEIFLIKGKPIWFFLPYSFVMKLELFTPIKNDVIYKSSDLILADKELIEKKIIAEFQEINKEILLKKGNGLVFEVDSFELIIKID